jgi:hypothetical protein
VSLWPTAGVIASVGGMPVPYRGFSVPLAAAAVIAVAAACSGSPGGPGAQVPAGRYATPLVVPAGEGGGALSATHTLTVPAGWTARVWARVPDARMEAWTPGGDLLVSEPDDGKIAATAAPRCTSNPYASGAIRTPVRTPDRS